MITQEDEKEMKVKTMEYRQPIIDRLDKQTAKGIDKYGNTIDRSGHLRSGLQRLEYLAEELTDALVYGEDLKEHIQQAEEDRRFLFELVRKMEMNMISDEEALTLNAIAERLK